MEGERAITLGLCRREHLPEIRKMLEDAPEAAQWSEEALAAVLSSETDLLLVAWNRNELAGFILGRSTGSEAEILNLAVKREFRRMGVGSGLVKAMLTRLESSGSSRIFLEVRESNQGAIAFYRGVGFKEVGRRLDYYRDPQEAALVLARET
ncbi:MAG TPA: ribosomal protein S18-alanine N-acetyltransferase [Dongiaceae bacterium]|nr:ribosomal protein S18-alanine N-acetyltransferase [Dongiaceae bacterium]